MHPEFISHRSGKAKMQINAAMVNISFTPLRTDIKANCTPASVSILRDIWDDGLYYIQEQVYVLFINHANHLICWRCINSGSSTSTLVNNKLIITIALNCAASKIIISHNHPSGNPKPSPGDIKATKTLKMVCAAVDIEVLDHIILTGNSHYSFFDNDLL